MASKWVGYGPTNPAHCCPYLMHWLLCLTILTLLGMCRHDYTLCYVHRAYRLIREGTYLLLLYMLGICHHSNADCRLVLFPRTCFLRVSWYQSSVKRIGVFSQLFFFILLSTIHALMEDLFLLRFLVLIVCFHSLILQPLICASSPHHAGTLRRLFLCMWTLSAWLIY